MPMEVWYLTGAFVTALLLSFMLVSVVGPHRKDWFVGVVVFFIAICLSVLLWPISAGLIVKNLVDLFHEDGGSC